MGSEQFALCWNNFHKHMSSGMFSLLENEDLVDVTLAVEGRYLKAHKIVLSVCSPYFRELFQSNPCKHPIVFMKDVSYSAINDLLQFMYQGEVQVAQEQLNTFIKTAEALQVKGLTGDSTWQNESEVEDVRENQPEASSTPKVQNDTVKTPTAKRVVEIAAIPALKRLRSSSRDKNAPATSTTVLNSSKILKLEAVASASESQAELVDESDMNYAEEDVTVTDEQDDAEDYGLLDTGDDEPKPGTSTDLIGENKVVDVPDGKASKKRRSSINRTRYISNGFVYHTSVVRLNPSLRYLICSKYASTGCHARAILPLDASVDLLRVTRPHNHPPDDMAEEKSNFITQLKQVTQASPQANLKTIFEDMMSLHPRLSSEINFESIRTTMRRWRRAAMDKYYVAVDV